MCMSDNCPPSAEVFEKIKRIREAIRMFDANSLAFHSLQNLKMPLSTPEIDNAHIDADRFWDSADAAAEQLKLSVTKSGLK